MSRLTSSSYHCDKLVSLFLNRTQSTSDEDTYPTYIRQLLLKKNSSLSSSRSLEECLHLFQTMGNVSADWPLVHPRDDDRSLLAEHSSSLIIFILLISLVSLISVLGNLSLAKILFSKRDRLLQTDRIVLCLALSELGLVLIDTPTEIYRFLSYSFTLEWLCRFHSFFESLFSSCIIFFHLLGAFDRFVYLHGNISSVHSRWSNACRSLSTRSGSLLLLLIPLVCSVPISICNCFHAKIIYTSPSHKICIVQYNHRLLISLLVSFYLIPLILSFIFHGKLVYLICKRHEPISLTAHSLFIPLTSTQQASRSGQRRFHSGGHPRLDQRYLTSPSTSTTLAHLPVTRQGTSSPSSSRSSSTPRDPSSRPVVLYKVNSQANANANRTVILLVLLLSFYVFCWAPYNVYTWYHAYQLTHRSPSVLVVPLNSTGELMVAVAVAVASDNAANLHSNLRRIIFLNYSLYLLSMVSMCFSFIFYFTLNKQGRLALSRWLSCLCPKIRYEKTSSRDERILHHPHHFDEYHLRGHRSPRSVHQSRYPPAAPRTITRPSPSPSPRRLHLYQHQHQQPQPQQQRIQLKKPKKISLNYQFQIQCCP